MICYLCGDRASEIHHIFNGAMRKKSEIYGATIPLCRECHDEIHKNATERLGLKAEFQKKIMAEQGWSIDEFREIFKKNYI
jgi:hypothetical protein